MDNLSGFIIGRQIFDGILIINKVVNEARKNNKKLLMFKVDFKKSYDLVDWVYLQRVMESDIT